MVNLNQDGQKLTFLDCLGLVEFSQEALNTLIGVGQQQVDQFSDFTMADVQGCHWHIWEIRLLCGRRMTLISAPFTELGPKLGAAHTGNGAQAL